MSVLINECLVFLTIVGGGTFERLRDEQDDQDQWHNEGQ